MSLTQCITKAGKALSRENKAAIMAASRKYRQQGMSPDEAGIKAVDDRIAEVRALLEAAAKAPAPQDQPVVASAPADARQTAAVEPERKAEPGAASAAPIEDAGEKIGGARKDWRDPGLTATDLDAMSEAEGASLVTKANVWKPDYQAIVSDGGDPSTAAMVKVVYDALAAQPKKNTPEGRRDYVRAMQAVREVYSAVRTPDEAKNAFRKVREALGLREGASRFAEDQKNAARLLFSVYKGRSDPFVFSHKELTRARKMVVDGFPGAVEPWTRRFVVRAVGGPGLTDRGVEIYVKQAQDLGTPMTAEQLRAGAFEVRDKSGRTHGLAPTKADAEAMAKTIYDLARGGGDSLAEPKRPHLDFLKRENMERAIDRDAVPSDMLDDFGFRGIEWGNWAAQDERQKILNMAYDAMADLARVLNVPRRALSLNGALGIAFGARGGGRFAAHYEPGKLVINMTKLQGAGSLAHEFAHAFDHYLGELGRADAYQTLPRGVSGWHDEQRYDGRPARHTAWAADGKATTTEQARLSNLRPELADKLEAVMRALFTGQQSQADMLKEMDASIARAESLSANAANDNDMSARDMYARRAENYRAARAEIAADPATTTYPRGRSAFAAEAQKLSGKSTKGYWLRPTEMFARAFESYVFDRLVAMGGRSDYLVHGVEADRYASGGYRGNPYPTGEERAAINRAFDAMVAELKTRTDDDGKVAMFSRSGQGVEFEHGQSRLIQGLSGAGFDEGGAGRLVRSESTEPSLYTAGRARPLPYSEQSSARDIDAEEARLIARAKEEGFFWGAGKMPGIAALLGRRAAGGNEHDVFIVGDPPNRVVIRKTVKDSYGFAFRSPSQYLKRIDDYNRVFPNIQVRVIGVSRSPVLGKLSDNHGKGVIWTAQTFVEGTAFANSADLHTAMVAHGWERLKGLEYRHKETGVIIDDVHHGNVLQRDGNLFPIDVVIKHIPDEAKASRPAVEGRSEGLTANDSDSIASAMAKAGISGVNVVESVDDLPADKRDVVLSSEPSGNIRGAYFKDDDSVWIVSGNIKSAQEMIFVAMHEAFHRGLARTLGPDAKRVLKGMYLTNGRLRELADQQRATHKIGLYEAIEEALADLAGHGKARDLRGWDKLLKMIRSWLGKFADAVGVQITWTDGMIEDFVAGMRREGMSGDAKITTTLPASIQRVIDAVGKDFKTHEQALAHLKERGFAVRRDERGAVVVVDSKGADVPYSDAPRDIVHAWNILAIDEQMDPDGDFDSPVAFSRSAKAFSSLRAAKLPAGYIVNDFIKSSGKVGWWSKTVGTMHNLAERSPAFRKVYDAANAFINDVSFYATEAADKAPTLLPKLETIRDLTKSPLSPEDTKAISAPIFQGTLSWTRDKSGAPVQESDPQKAGIVWTDAELAKKFGLSPRQIGLYREFRDSVDLSLKNLAVSDMLSLGGKDLAHLADAAMAAKTVGEAAQMMKTALADMAYVASPDRAAILADTGEKIGEKAEQAQRLMDRGYAPLMRYGHYTLDVVDKDGERIYFGLFESERDANKMAREMLANNPGATVTQGTMSEKAYQMFAGVSPETLELFGNMLGLESQGDEAASNAFQEYLKLVKANRSAMKRLIERKGTAGFSEDAGRVLAGFVYSNARQTSKNLHFGNLTRATNDIAKDKSQGELRDVAGDLRQYITNPREEAQKIRGLMFAQFLGGSVASAMVNLTQPVAVTFPYLSQFGGAMKAAAQMKRALSDALKWESQRLKSKRTTGDKALDAALHRAEEDGIVSPQEVHQLIAQAGGSAALRAGDGTAAGNAIAAAQNRLSKLMLLWGRPFAVAEQFNRRATFIAAYRVAVDQKMADPFKFAEKAIIDTQFNYTKANRPQWARGAIGATLFTFKQYSISYVELMTRLARSGPEGRKAAAIGLAVLFLMSGLQGLPGADDLDDLIDAAMQRLGYNWNTKAEKRELLASIVGDGGAQFLMRGVSGLPGVPIDVAGRLGLGNLIPGTGVLTKKDDHTRDVLEVLGPAGSLAQQVGKGAAALAEGEVARAAKEVLPVAAANAVKAADMWSTGMYRDSRGRKVIDTDAIDAVFKAIGFQPNDVARVQRATQEVQSMVSQARLREAEIADKWARGMFEQNRDIVDDARAELERWNDRNPESRIKITSAQLVKRLTAMRQDKAQRLAKTAPAEMRNTVRKELAGIK